MGETVTLDIRVLPEGAPQDVAITGYDTNLITVTPASGGGRITGLTAGETLLTVTAGTVTLTVPARVILPDDPTLPMAGVGQAGKAVLGKRAAS